MVRRTSGIDLEVHPELDEIEKFYSDIFEEQTIICQEDEDYLDAIRNLESGWDEVLEGCDEIAKFNIGEIRPQLNTEPDTAFFWSGKTDGIGGAEVPAYIAKEN